MKTFLTPALVAAVSGSALAQTQNPSVWKGGSGNWFDAAKWTGGPPGSDTAPAPAPAHTYLALQPWTAFVGTRAYIDNGTTTFSPGITTVYNYSDGASFPYLIHRLAINSLDLGQSGTGSLIMRPGASLLAAEVRLGNNPGSAGHLETSGAPQYGSTRNLDTSGDVIVGGSGIGRLDILDGAVMSYWDNTVIFPTGGGGVRKNIRNMVMGGNPGSNGFTKVSGTGSTLFHDTTVWGGPMEGTTGLVIGRQGIGGLKIEAGGTVRSRAARLGLLAGSEGISSVTGAGSLWENDAQIYIGEGGEGSLMITNGGLVRSGFGFFGDGTHIDVDDPDVTYDDYGSIGKHAGSNGSVFINGSSSRWENNANLIVGEAGTGTLDIEEGTVVSAYRASGPSAIYEDVPNATIGLFANSNGTVSVKGTGGRWQNGSGLTIGDAGTGKLIVGSGGTVDVGGGGVVLLGQTGSGTLVFGGNNAGGVGTLGGTVVQGGAGTSVVQFQHNLASYTPTHRFDKVTSLQNTGPGKTVLPKLGFLSGAVIASAGTLEIGPSATESTTEYLGAQTGGKLIINGTSVRTPDVAVPRTLVGLTGNGEISVVNGGTLHTTLLLGGGPATGGTGQVTIEGENSRVLLRNTSLVVGGLGDGWLALKSAGRISNTNSATKIALTLGEAATGNGILSLSDFNTQLSTGPLTVGAAGRGTIYADSYGALLQSDASVIGAQATGDGFVRLNNNVSWRVNANELVVGDAGKGMVELATGASLRIGPQGDGDLVLGNRATGQGVLKIGAYEAPGTLLARYVSSGLGGPSRAQVRINHTAADYTLSPTFIEVDFRLVSGNLGATTLTSSGNFLSHASVTSGGLRLAAGGRIYMDDEIIIGDGEIFDMDESSLPFLEVDGATSVMDAANGIMVGKSGAGEVRLKNGGTLIVRNTIHQAQHSVILGNDAANNFGSSTLIFGGSATTAPGILDASGIHSYASDGKVIFNHSSSNFIMPALIGGNAAVRHLAGTTLLSNTYQGYTGTTTVTGGTLLVTANLPSIVTLTTSASEFGGLGTTARVNAHSGSTISPGTFRAGEEIASMRITALNFFGGSKVKIDMGPNLTCDKILNHQVGGVATTLFPVTSGTVTFDFRDRGIDRNGAYPILTTTNAFTTTFMDRLAFTSGFPLQGYFRQTPVASGGVSYHQLEFVVTSFESSYATWVRLFGLDPLGNGAPGEDADHDGLKNLMEYVLGSSPISGVSQNLPAMELTGSSLIFSFAHRPEITGTFVATVEYSTDLDTWTTAALSAVQSSFITGRGLLTTATLLRPTDGKPLFARLRITGSTP